MTLSPDPNARPATPSLWRSKLLLLAVLSLLVGTGLWIREAVTAPPAPEPPAARGLVGAVPREATTVAPQAEAPFTFRVGAGFTGGFFVAWVMRKFIRLTLLVGGAIVAMIAVLKSTGIIDFDWSGTERAVEDGLHHVQQQASGVKDFLMRHIPSGFATVCGMFVGARRA